MTEQIRSKFLKEGILYRYIGRIGSKNPKSMEIYTIVKLAFSIKSPHAPPGIWLVRITNIKTPSSWHPTLNLWCPDKNDLFQPLSPEEAMIYKMAEQD